MDDELPLPPDAPESADHEDEDGDEDEEQAAAPLPTLPPEISSGDEELRRLIEAGASTPEELRDLAARIREHREREDALWRDEMRPALKKAKKAKFRLGDLVERPEEPPVANSLFYVLIIAGLAVVLVLAATRTSIIWVLVPIVAVFGYAYAVGRRGDDADAPPEPPPTTDEDASG